ncbi:hypothetical protein C3I27_03450 [Campylobacter jejuni]|uniref:Tail sheath protein n=1 Tax=Campylobacter jejuni TaxID=197 RepID=A0AAX1Z4T5_CAMJU|nr:hypothetical protein [Campylobacter jejuni]RTI48482.1 hypothetical protein C3I27_03450 [Campylobacter jejuni]
MGASKISVSVVDRSTLIPALEGIYALIAFQTERGPLEPQLVTSQTDLKSKYGAPQLKYGTGYFSAKGFLTQSNKLWVKRVVSPTAKYAAMIVKGKINNRLSDTDGVPSPDFKPESVIIPQVSYDTEGNKVYGLSDQEITTFAFNVYPAERQYKQINARVAAASTDSNRVRVSTLSGFKMGMRISIADSTPNNESPLYEILGTETVPQFLNKVKLKTKTSANAGDKVWSLTTSDQPTSILLAEDATKNAVNLKLSTVESLKVGDVLKINDLETVTVKTIHTQEDETEDLRNSIDLVKGITQNLNMADSSVKKVIKTGTFLNSYVSNSIAQQNEVIVSKSDDIINGDTIVFTAPTVDEHSFSTDSEGVVVSSKDTLENDWYYISLDQKVSPTLTNNFYELITASEEERDSLLVYAASPGDWGKDLSVSINEDTNYDKGFKITVYYKGEQVEQFSGTTYEFIDGYGSQKFIEQVVNKQSSYIKVKFNTNYVDEDGRGHLPLYTTKSLWRQEADEIFDSYSSSKRITTLEDVLLNDKRITCTDASDASMGDRIKFRYTSGVDTVLSKEYKIASKETDVQSRDVLILDREIEEKDRIPSGAEIVRFNPAHTDEARGIYEGKQYYSIRELPRVYPYQAVNTIVYQQSTDSDGNIIQKSGVLIDAGSNLFLGGTDGDPVTQADMINAYKVYSTKIEYPGQLMLDGGYTTPSFAKSLTEILDIRQDTHLFISSRLSDEQSANYLKDIVAYRQDLGFDRYDVSIYTGWMNYFDPDLQLDVLIPPDGPAAACQSYTARQQSIFYPSGGYTNGKVDYALSLVRKFTEGDLDYLVDNQINPFRQDQGTILLWGNETSYKKASPLQVRSTAMLMLYITSSLNESLKYFTWTQNNQSTWSSIRLAIDKFMREEIQAKGGVYAYTIGVEEVTTDSDIDNRTINVFIGVQPTSDVKFINCKVAIFGKSNEMTVSWI